MKDRVCTSCEHIGKPVNQDLSSFLVDILAWGTFGSGALVSGMLGWLAIPLLWTVYHLAHFRTVQCPECGDLEMVSMKSRKGRKVLSGDDGVTVWKPAKVIDIKKAA